MIREEEGKKGELKHEKRKATRREDMGESEWIDILPPMGKKTRKRMATEQLTGPRKKARRATGPIKMHRGRGNVGPDGVLIRMGETSICQRCLMNGWECRSRGLTCVFLSACIFIF